MPEARRQLVWSAESEDDLLTIWRSGALRSSPGVADAHLRDIHRAAGSLVDFPYSGVKRDRIVPGIRSVVVYPTVIFHPVAKASKDIVRVADGRRNLAALFSADRDG